MLNKTKITATACALALTAGIGIPVLAASTPKPSDVPEFKQRIELTDEQKAEMEAKRAEMEAEMEARRVEREAKWAALTDEQKAEIDSIQDQIKDLQSKLKDKYVEFGLLNAEDAENGAIFRMKGEMSVDDTGVPHARAKGRMSMGEFRHNADLDS